MIDAAGVKTSASFEFVWIRMVFSHGYADG
jgi:hypothetical protein